MKKTLYIAGALWAAVVLLPVGSAAAQVLNCGDDYELLPYFPSATMHEVRGYQGFVRLVNYGLAGWIQVVARTDEGAQGVVDVEIPGNSTVHFNSEDLEDGNPSKGIYYGGIDVQDAQTAGLWSLCVNRQGLEVEATSYVRSDDGFLTEATLPVQGHDASPDCIDSFSIDEDLCAKWVIPIFNPGYNTNQVSMLRILNNTASAKIVEIRGTRSDGTNTYCEDEQHERRVLFSLAGSQGVTLNSVELETGSGLSSKLTPVRDSGISQPLGMIGRARGKWVIEVFADADSPEELVVMNLLYAPRNVQDGGSIVNLSANADDAVTRRKDYNAYSTPRRTGRGDPYCPDPMP